ncbi:MAG TPA: endonuclease, partial [Candidatus Hydrogenedentes bacterium]|nr:endonuclease [Candidatus Hydrogenedentota bacterium]
MAAHYGPTGWWPGDTPFEVAVGAILTQNTAWTNVEKAI